MKKTLIGLTVVATLALAACGSSGGSSSGPTTTASPLAGTSWQLVSYPLAGTGASTPVPDNVKVTADFADAKVAGNGGCNNYMGPYTTDGSKMTIGPVSSTMMACDALAIESAFTTALDAVATYAVTSDKLTLTTKDGKVLAFTAGAAK